MQGIKREENWIECWFKYCHRENVKPWEWDFKQCYVTKEEYDKNTKITNFLKYKGFELNDTGEFNNTGNTGSEADCDKEAFPIYKVLEWQGNRESVIRGETMNSARSIFTTAIKKSENKDKVYKKIKIDTEKYLWKQLDKWCEKEKYLKFYWIEENIAELEKFAGFTHTIGNFTVLPWWMNTGRARFKSDYWDSALESLRDFLDPLGGEVWKNFIERYRLEPFVNKDYTVAKLWLPTDKKERSESERMGEFLRRVNLSIEERGKYLIKELCEKQSKTGYDFYTEELKKLQKIQFAEELWNK